MTASLPVPRELPSDDEGTSARAPQRGPRALPPPPLLSAAEAAAQPAVSAAASGDRPARRPPAPRKRPAKKSRTIDPGPPPPLPPLPVDLDAVVIPPRPPLPAVDAAVAAADIEVAELVVPPMPPAPPSPSDEALVVEAAAAEPAVAEPDGGDPEPETAGAVPTGRAAPGAVAEDPPPTATSAVTSVFDTDLAAASVHSDTAALSVRGVTKVFGDTRAVDGIDLIVPSGTFYGLVGPNGAGKTTTLSMIAGLLRPDRGTITVAGVDAAAKPRAAKKIMGVLPDRLRTFDRLTGRQLLYYSGVLRGLAPSVVESRTADLARAFDLADSLGRPVSDYSAGMTKKVMLAAAMIHSPRLLVLDEPFESVDPVSSGVILDILGAYVAHGGTVILSSHGMDLVERVCSRVAVMVSGQVLAEGTIDEVRGELTLEQRFIELAGGLSDVEDLEWLHTFSG